MMIGVLGYIVFPMSIIIYLTIPCGYTFTWILPALTQRKYIFAHTVVSLC